MRELRIVVLSDSHGNRARIRKIAEQQINAELFIFLGDGVVDFRSVMEQYPNKDYWCVRGNCDFSSQEESTAFSWCKDVKILYTHGHQWNVKCGLEDLREQAQKGGAQVALFGHTHCPSYKYEEGIHFMNPGSVGNPRCGIWPTYGIIDIQGKSIVCHVVEFNE